MRAFPTFLLALSGLAACRTPGTARPSPAAGPPVSRTGLRAWIDSMADAPEFSNAHWGILIVDPLRGDTLYARNAGKLFMPASNMKILTSATALTQLGPDFRFTTTFAGRGEVRGDTLAGDLVVFGRGDPSVSDHVLGDAMLPLRAVADSIAMRGIHHITGRLVAGGNAFPGAVLGYGWSYDDFEHAYSAPIDELLFNEGFSRIHVRGGAAPGDPVEVSTSPARTYPRVRVLARTGSPEAADGPTLSATPARRRTSTLRTRKDSTTWDIVLDGEIAPGAERVLEVTDHDPARAYLAAVREALTDRGITIGDADGSANPERWSGAGADPERATAASASADTTARLDTLAVLSSPPLRDILPALMKPSQNQIAEMLFRTVALEATGQGRADSARAVVQRQIAGWGVTPDEAVVRDGSGLSRYDYISPRTVVRILDAMRQLPDFPVFYDALPIAGVDGTISNRMKGTPAENNVHAKTGTLALARSLSGYVTTADGQMLIFSFLCNNWTVPVRAVEQVQDAIAARLASLRLR